VSSSFSSGVNLCADTRSEAANPQADIDFRGASCMILLSFEIFELLPVIVQTCSS